MSISRTLLTTLAATATTAALAGAAAGAAQAQTPVPPEAFKPVSTDVKILGAGGGVVEHRACEWTEPQADDLPCIRFNGDPKRAIAEIGAAGGVAAKVHVTSAGLDKVTRISRRADRTWLLRTRGVSNGQSLDFGFVCDAAGERCTLWDSAKADSAQDAVRAAAARLRR